MSKRVVIVGGGVAGMSAAQALAERNDGNVQFDVHVYEKQPRLVGGKARSIPVPDSGTEGRPNLPGEHGFRFFPRFYRHLPDSMKRIPYGDSFVFENLIEAKEMQMARFDQPPVNFLTHLPRSWRDLRVVFRDLFESHLGLQTDEVEFFADRIWQVLTSCNERRLAEYEKISWSCFLKAKQFSQMYDELLVDGLSRSLLANDPELASARTVGDTNVQLMFNMTETGGVDRLLNGPTSEVWLNPWYDYLEKMGVVYHKGVEALSIQTDGNQVTGVTLTRDGNTIQAQGDYYLFALPVEKMAALLRASGSDGPLELDSALAGILKLKSKVAWMNGIQFFLKEDVSLVPGHSLYVSTPWSLTSVSEIQFWKHTLDITDYGDGQVKGILSVCISAWDEPGILYHKPARECTRREIKDEVWAQLVKSVNVDGATKLQKSNLHSWFLDPDIKDDPSLRSCFTDLEPLLVNEVDTWRWRPEACTAIPNMWLASDYVRTFTDVACMEGANEAARRAVNGILKAAGSNSTPCQLWPLHEPDILNPFRRNDLRRFNKGKPWNGKFWH